MSQLNQKQKSESEQNQSPQNHEGDEFTIQKSVQIFKDLTKTASCNCKKNQCSKINCQCFAQGRKCGDTCRCLGCENIQGNEMKKKKKSEEDQGQKKNKKSCQCKKTQCLKKYCDCFNSGQVCNENCRCEDCKNTVSFQLNINPHPDTSQIHHYSQLVEENVGRGQRKQQQLQEKIDRIIKIIPTKLRENVMKYLVFSLSQE